MNYMLDIDICVSLIRQNSPLLFEKIRSFELGDLGVSVITVAELQYGVHKSQRPEQARKALLKTLESFEIVDFNINAALAYGRIRTDLEKSGQRIGPYDLLIAAHAKTLGVTLVTGNVREFNRVADLAVENWLR